MKKSLSLLLLLVLLILPLASQAATLTELKTQLAQVLSQIATSFGLEVSFSSTNTLALVGQSSGTPQNVSHPEHKVVPDHILVKFKDNVGQEKKAEVMAKHGLKEKSEIKQIGVKILTISPNETPEAVVERLKAQEKDSIEFAEPDYIIQPAAAPVNDPYYGSEWHLPKISAPQAWTYTTGSSSVIIAFVDTGVEATHPDLESKIVPGWNIYNKNSDTSDVYGHGTNMAGYAAASSNNGVGVAAPARDCRIMPVRVSDASGGSTTSLIAAGLTWAADHGARVANTGFAVDSSSTVTSAAQYFMSKGGVVTMPAGNDGAYYAAPDNPYVLTVSATDSADNLASWTTTGNNVDLAAPGVSIYTTVRGAAYGAATDSGTCASAAITAGVAALVISANPSLTGEQVQDIIKKETDDLGPSGWDSSFGWGRVNAYKSVLLALGTPPPPPPPTDTTPPTTPVVTDEGATTIRADQLYASYNASDAESGIAEYQYKITQDSISGSLIRDWTSSGTTSYVTAGGLTLLNGKSYYFGVKAKNGAGLWSAVGYSNGILVSVPDPNLIQAPNGLTAIASGRNITPKTITLTWSDNSNNEEGFSIEQGLITGKGKTAVTTYTRIGQTLANATNYILNVSAGTYYFRVQALNVTTGRLSAYSNAVKVGVR